MWPSPQETADLVTSTEEIHKGKLYFCAVLVVLLKVLTQDLTEWDRKGSMDLKLVVGKKLTD